MDFRDHSIVTQVAFKGVIDLESELDLTSDEGRSRFEEVFSYLQGSLLHAVRAGESDAEQAANLVRANFPGTQNVATGNTPHPSTQPAPQQMANGSLSVKGSQNGPLPDWLYAAAAEKGVTEVYDNRDRAMGTKRPWFRSTTGGDNAPAFWPPRS